MPAVGLVEARDEVERRALAAARRPEQRDEGAVRDLERQVVERAHLAVVAREVLQAE